MGKFGQDAGVTPLLFFEGHPGIFNDHRESGPRFNISSEGRNHNHNHPGYDLPIQLVLMTIMEHVLVNKNLFMLLLFHLAYTTLRMA